MGLFRFLTKSKNDSGLSKQLIGHLDVVDAEYMRSFNIKSTKALQSYVSRECAVKVSQAIYGYGSRYFGAPKYRKTSWSLVSSDGDTITVAKDVHFDEVRVGGAISIGVADDYRELWRVKSASYSPVVVDIQSDGGGFRE